MPFRNIRAVVFNLLRTESAGENFQEVGMNYVTFTIYALPLLTGLRASTATPESV